MQSENPATGCLALAAPEIKSSIVFTAASNFI
jgi:hypothetical protein